jgi:succinoglycan biosynthesis transport protein ExoP
MLQKRLPESAFPASDLLSLKQSLSTLKGLVDRQRYVLLLTILSCVGLALTYVFMTPKAYTATAALFLDSHKTQSLQQQSPMGLDIPVDSSMVDSQVEILKSESIALSVIKELGLAEDPEFTGPSGDPIDTIMRVIGSLLAFGTDIPTPDGRLRATLSRFQENLTVKRLFQSYVIELSYRSRTPDRAAKIANAVAEAYIVDSLEAKYQSSRRAAGWLQDRLKELRAQASSAERAVVDYKAKNNIVDSGGRLLTEQQLAEVNSTLTIARTQRAESEARLERVTQILRSENADGSALFDNLATVADTLRNEVITRLRQQYLDLSAREADWSGRYGRNHLAVVNLRNQMREIRKSITDELRRIAETYKSDVEIARAREDSAQKALSETIAASNDTSQAQIVLRDLESNAQSARALADNFLQLYMMSVQQQSFPITDARIITKALPPLRPSSPKSVLILIAALLGGSILALLICLYRDLSDAVFRTSRQVEDHLGVSCLASVPYVRSTKARTAYRHERPKTWMARIIDILDTLPYASKSASRNARRMLGVEKAGSTDPFARSIAPPAPPERILHMRQDVGAMMVNAPFSSFAESIRAVKLAIDLAASDNGEKIIGVTSSLPNEGKSTISLAVASAMSQGRLRTLLVDGDIRNPALTRILTPAARTGLIDVVLENAAPSECIWTDASTDLHFLPCVLSHKFSNSGDILSSSMMEALFHNLRKHYDRIILDLSPLAPVIDVRATTKIVDNYLMVISWAGTSIDVVDRALDEAPAVRQRLLGTVLNKVEVGLMRRYDSNRSGYYHNKYYKAYGYVE